MRGAWSLYSACTITCTSLRSGSASSGVRLSAHTPPAIAPTVKSSTMSFSATDHAMMRFSMAASRFFRRAHVHPRLEHQVGVGERHADLRRTGLRRDRRRHVQDAPLPRLPRQGGKLRGDRLPEPQCGEIALEHLSLEPDL